MGSTIESGDNRMRITQVADGFDTPWALAFLPEGGVLVTEREGRLWILGPDDGRTRIDGVPRVRAQGQGGLLDVMVPRDFGQSREVFLSYSKPQENGGAGTALAVGWLNAARNQLENLRVLFEMRPGSRGGRHFGSRIVEAPDGTIFLTIGERGDRPSAQDLTRHNGSIVRVRRDGSVPEDNPFTDHAEAQPEIWSYGHRNPQGAALDLEGQLWAVEHGARGGDEINRIQRGANYGWPVVSYGTHYSGEKIGEGTSKEGMEQPAFYWDPSIAPSGMMIYSGKLWPDWRGQMFIGSLKFDHISRLGGEPIKELDRMSSDETERVRDVIEAPDGSIWFISEGRGAIYRLDPQ
nr:PQQ-dependent sugar dehydrogenase [Salinihabitans flavidus]